MKKLLTFLVMSILAIGVGWAATSTLTFTEACGGSGTANDGATWAVTSDAAESTFDATRGIHYGTSKVAVSYLNLTTSDISGTITQIKVNASGASQTTAKCNVTVGGSAFGSQVSLTSSATDYTFTGSASGTIVVSLTQTSAKRALYVKSIVVTYDDGGVTLEKVATPTFSLPAGHYTSAQDVTISCATAGADIYWGYDGVNFASYDGSSILVNETKTLYAYAMKSGMDDSEVASIKYYIETPAQPGDEVMFDYRTGAEFAQGNATAMEQSSKQGITIDFAKGEGENTPTWYSSSNGNARVYKNNTITVNAGDLVIEKVTFAFEETYVISNPTPSVGSYSEGVWTVGDKSAVLTMNPDASVARIATITVKLADAGVIVVAAPTIRGNESFVGSTEVTITAEDGASIYYTKDGTDPTVESTPYTVPFTINETTTVKAIAAIEGTLSSIASKTFTATPSVSTVAAFNALDDNTVIGFTGELVAIAQEGKYLYAQDNENGILIYGDIEPDYTLGNVIPGGFTGTKKTFKGAPEMENPSGLVASTSTVQVTPIELTPSQVDLDNFGRYAVIKGATISNGKIVVADQNVTCYTNTLGVNIPDDYEGKTYDIIGVCGYYNSPQFLPLKFNEVSATVYPDYYLVGTFNTWAQQDSTYKFTRAANGSYYLNDVDLADDVSFKVIKVENGTTTWLGGADNGDYPVTGADHTDMDMFSGKTTNYYMAAGGVCDFTISTNEELSIAKDAQLFMKGSYSYDDWATKTPLEATNTGWTITMELAAGTQFGFVDEWDNWKGGNGYWIYQNEHEYNGETAPSDMGKELDIFSNSNFVMVDAGNYVLTVNSELTKLVVTLVLVPHSVIVADNIVNGTVTANPTEAVAGTTITLTATPNEGYVLDAFTVMAGENPIEVTGNTFEMPDQDVTVSATFKEFVLASYFKLVTDINELDGGKQILFAGVNEENVYVMSAPADNGNNMTAQAVVDPMGTPPSFLSYTDGYKVFSLGEFGDNYTFYDVETQKYLRATSSTNNRMGLGDLDNNARASVTLNEDGTFSVVFQGENTRNNMRFNINASNNNPLFACYTSTSELPFVYIYVETEEIPQPVVLDGVAFTADRQWATWYGDANLALPEGATAYVVTGVQDDAVAVEALDYIPANTGVLLFSETADESVSAMPYTGEAGTIPTSLLVGSLEAQTVSNAYLLYNNQFILAQDGTTVGAHRCYLPMSTSAQGAPVLRIGAPGTVTGVETINTNGNGDNTYYNLMGQPVTNPAPGIYIRGGKKVIVK
jgi:hypothetical protein